MEMKKKGGEVNFTCDSHLKRRLHLALSSWKKGTHERSRVHFCSIFFTLIWGLRRWYYWIYLRWRYG